MDKKQIKAIINKRFKLPVVVLAPFNTIGLAFFDRLGYSNFMQLTAGLVFTALNAMLIIALMTHMLSNVLCDINELNKKENQEQN